MEKSILEILYISTTVIAICGYIPQIIKLLTDKTDSQSLAMGTWSLWTYTNLVAFTYICIINKDPLIMISSGCNALGTIAVLNLILFNRFLKMRLTGGVEFSIIDLIKAQKPKPVEKTFVASASDDIKSIYNPYAPCQNPMLSLHLLKAQPDSPTQVAHYDRDQDRDYAFIQTR